MLIRIVKLEFEATKIATFLHTFEAEKEVIRNFPGCLFLELYNDIHNTSLYFTYSYWENEAALENYRNSDLFKQIWAKTKVLFKGKPEAWSVNKIESLS